MAKRGETLTFQSSRYRKKEKITQEEIKNYCNMFKIYKDIVFWCVVLIWLILNIVVANIDKSMLFFSNNIMIIFMCILIFLKNTNIKFENWLNTKIRK